MGWQWHQLDHMQIICTLLQTDNHASTSTLFTGWMLYLMPNQQCQSTEVERYTRKNDIITVAQQHRLRWHGQVFRKDKNEWVQKCMDYKVEGLRPRGTHTHTTNLRPFFRNHPGEPVPEENFWTSWCKGRLTEADTQTIRLGATPSGLTSAHLHHPPIFL